MGPRPRLVRHAGEGKPATLVLTDIEGSTELWEWDASVMMEAQALHDRIIRSQLAQFCGYEVATEGDAFLLVFHEPADAVSWAVATQQVRVWPRPRWGGGRRGPGCGQLKRTEGVVARDEEGNAGLAARVCADMLGHW